MSEAEKQFGRRKPTRVFPAHAPPRGGRLPVALIVGIVLVAAAVAATALF